MEILEQREEALRKQLWGRESVAAHSTITITDRILELNARLDQLNSVVAGFVRLGELYHGNKRHLEMQPSSSFDATTTKQGDEIKRAMILSSEDRVDEIVKEFHRLQELHGVLGQLEQISIRASSSDQQLGQLETQTEQQTQRALALHARVERILTVYQEMISFSSNCSMGKIHLLVMMMNDGYLNFG